MTRTLLWDAGPGEMRAGIIEDGRLTEFRIIRQRRDKALLQAGEIYTVRIGQRVDNSSALASIDFGEDGIITPCPHSEGSLVAALMTRPPIPEPGRWKRAKFRPAPDIAPRARAGWHFSDEPWILFLKDMAKTIDVIICPTAAAANEVEADIGGAVPVQVDPARIAAQDFDGLIEQAVTGEFPIADGVLSIEHTRAMTVIDIDGTGRAEALNQAAARAIPPLLRLLDIGGPVAIDFIASANRAERLAIDATLAEACTVLGPHERTAINGFGLAQIIRPKTRLSIPQLLCGTTPGHLSTESKAVALLREAGRSQGVGARHLVAHPAIIDLVRQWPEETRALEIALGAALVLVPDPEIRGYGHVHVRQS